MSDCMYVLTKQELEELKEKLRVCQGFQTFGTALSNLAELLENALIEAAGLIAELANTFLPNVVEVVRETIRQKPKPKRPNYKANPRYNYKLDYRAHIYKINYEYRKE